MPERTLDGRRLAWRETGAGEPALLLHCGLAHSGAWSGVAARLADRLAMRAPDLPGHGRTGLDPARGDQDQALADALSLLPPDRPAHVVGHSFGGTVALRLAVAAPERVASLTLVEPVLFALLAEDDPAAWAAEMAAPERAAMAAGDWTGAATAFLARWGTGGGLGALPPAQQAAMVDGMPFVGRTASDILLPETARPRAAEIARIAAPVLQIAGDGSPPAVAAIGASLARLLPGARRATIPGAGHMAPITHPAEVAAAIRGFLGA